MDYSPYLIGLRKRKAEHEAALESRRRKAFETATQIAIMLRRDFGVMEVYLPGTTAQTGEFHEHSDIDLAVKGLPAREYFDAVAKSLSLGKEFSVDLLDFSRCRPELRSAIAKKASCYDRTLSCTQK